MASVDECVVLRRFPTADYSLIAKCYCRNGGLRTFFVPDYFKGEGVPLGSFEPFNRLKVHFEERNALLVGLDVSDLREEASRISRSPERFEFLSKVAGTVLRYAPEADEGIFELLSRAIDVEDFFGFNLLRFWLSFSSVLGFSLERLSRPGWVNLMTLSDCREDEVKNPYCVYLSPREFALLKRVGDPKTKPFEVPRRELKNLEEFFEKFLAYHKG
ncbi:MAG: hypothetical protein GXO08_04690 [Aquificae bacterium]|nr:hypothetical protein [Aquificota bacterium]